MPHTLCPQAEAAQLRQQQAAAVEAARREGKQLGETEAAQAHASALAAAEEAAQRAQAVATDNLQQQLAAAQQLAEERSMEAVSLKEQLLRADGARQALQASATAGCAQGCTHLPLQAWRRPDAGRERDLSTLPSIAEPDAS